MTNSIGTAIIAVAIIGLAAGMTMYFDNASYLWLLVLLLIIGD